MHTLLIITSYNQLTNS